MQVITSRSMPISSSATVSRNSGRGRGQGATVRDSPLPGRRCQISSVMKGMKGCSRRMACSSTVHNTYCAVRFSASSSP